MLFFLYIGTLTGLATAILLFIQDLQHRAVHPVLLALFAFAGIFNGFIFDLGYWWEMHRFSLCFAGLLASALLLYLFIREKNLKNIFNRFGPADLLMLFVVACWLHTGWYIAFIIGLNILLLSGVAVLSLAGKWQAENTIPLAGWMAVLVLPCWLIQTWLLPEIIFYTWS